MKNLCAHFSYIRIKNGCPPHKIILGLPAYGRSFTLKDRTKNGLASESYQNGTSGNFTKTSGFLSYYEICEIKKEKNWTSIWLPQSKSNYMYRDNDWISYDDIKSFHLRVNLLIAFTKTLYFLINYQKY